jgi:hypothetical protein
VNAPRVEIVVDRLVVHGLPAAEARRAAAAFEARLAALAARPGPPVPPRAESFRVAPAVTVRSSSATAVGEAAAGAVWGAVSAGARR